ncbi:tetratricopeptide repeat protein [Neptunomonas japonica]|uniref:tetratricopeptide repeat protein n=1 Tax=Neptunomonas japonica TaxID=417574 RepID=UPI00048AE4B6|nr:tetratricopeptide repeat protein [Neptunomonas japonica]
MQYLRFIIFLCLIPLYVNSATIDPSLSADSLYKKGISYLDRANRHPQKALEHLIIASDKGHIHSSYLLYLLYTNGIGTTIDKRKAKEYLVIAANKKHPDALHTLGHNYAAGIGVTKDTKQATSLFRLAAKAGHKHAKFDYSIRLIRGDGVTKNVPLAEKWMLKSAHDNNPMAQKKIAYWYRGGYEGIEKNQKKSHYWFKRAFDNFEIAATKKNASAQFEYAYMLSNGYGTKQNKAKAAKIYQALAKNNHAAAQFWLGQMYASGEAVTKDMNKAKELTLKSAAQNFRPALTVKQQAGW